MLYKREADLLAGAGLAVSLRSYQKLTAYRSLTPSSPKLPRFEIYHQQVVCRYQVNLNIPLCRQAPLLDAHSKMMAGWFASTSQIEDQVQEATKDSLYDSSRPLLAVACTDTPTEKILPSTSRFPMLFDLRPSTPRRLCAPSNDA